MLICLAQGHNTATRVGLEPPTSRSGVRDVNHQATARPYRGYKALNQTSPIKLNCTRGSGKKNDTAGNDLPVVWFSYLGGIIYGAI